MKMTFQATSGGKCFGKALSDGLGFSSWRSTLPEKGPYNWTGPSEYFVQVELPLEERDAGYPEDPNACSSVDA